MVFLLLADGFALFKYNESWIMVLTVSVVAIPVFLKYFIESIFHVRNKANYILGYYVPSFVIILACVFAVISPDFFHRVRHLEVALFPYFYGTSMLDGNHRILVQFCFLISLFGLVKILNRSVKNRDLHFIICIGYVFLFFIFIHLR